jgi:glycosyltransferase involved in cell wall biosynthesis
MLDTTVAIATFDDDPAVFGKVLAAVGHEEPARVVVVDMSRGNGIAGAVEAAGPPFELHRFRESRGLSDSRNRAVALADSRYLVFVDADAVPRRGWLRALRAAFDADERAAVVGARCLPEWPGRPPRLFETAPALDFLGMFDLGPARVEVPRVVGTSFALDMERLPGDEPFSLELGRREGSLFSAEEVAFCLAVRAAGWTCLYEPAAQVAHMVREGRDSWRWMVRRVHVAGLESRLYVEPLEPLPRRLSARDRVFQALVAGPFLAGRVRGSRSGGV